MEIFLSYSGEKTKTDCTVQRGKLLLPGIVEEGENCGERYIMIGTVDPEAEAFEESLYSGLKDALALAEQKRYSSISVDADSFVPDRALSAYVWNTLLERLTECDYLSWAHVSAVHLSMSMEGSSAILRSVERAVALPVKETASQSYHDWDEVEERLKKHLTEKPQSDPKEKSFRDFLRDLILAKPYKKNSEAYRACGISKSTFSKCLNYSIDYKPSKATVAAFAIGLKLDVESAENLYHSAGYHLGHIDLADRIVRFFLSERIYDIFEVNYCLAYYGLPLLGERPRDEKVHITRE